MGFFSFRTETSRGRNGQNAKKKKKKDQRKNKLWNCPWAKNNHLDKTDLYARGWTAFSGSSIQCFLCDVDTHCQLPWAKSKKQTCLWRHCPWGAPLLLYSLRVFCFSDTPSTNLEREGLGHSSNNWDRSEMRKRRAWQLTFLGGFWVNRR